MSIVREKIARLSDTKLILGIGLVVTILQVITFLLAYLESAAKGKEVNLLGLAGWRGLAWCVAMLFVILIVKTTKRFLYSNISWRRILGIHLLFSLLVSLVWYALFTGIHYALCTGKECDKFFSPMEMLIWYLNNFDKLFLIYLFSASITYTYYYIQRDSQHRIQRSQMEKQLLETRLMMLQSQLHPHFLFNTLNSIVSLMDIDIERAKAMTADLGGLLRHVLEKRNEQVVSLYEELKLLQQYLDIEKARFAEDLEVNMEADPSTFQAMVPSMLLQPLVENSIRHGFSREHPQLKINIHLYREGDRLVVDIQDDGKGFESMAKEELFEKGMGLHNTFERLKSLFGERFTFLVENLNPGFRNRIEIPLSFNL